VSDLNSIGQMKILVKRGTKGGTTDYSPWSAVAVATSSEDGVKKKPRFSLHEVSPSIWASEHS
jgi:hypothetical protein